MNLILVAILALVTAPAFAQSGTIDLSTTPTNSHYTITLPPADPGMNRVQVDAWATFDQSLSVTNPVTVEVPATGIFGSTLSMDVGAVSLGRAYRRSRIDFVAWPDATTSGSVTHTLGAGFTASLTAIPGRTFTLDNRVRSYVALHFPFGDQFLHQTSSFCANHIEWRYLP